MTHVLYFGSPFLKPYCKRSSQEDPSLFPPSINIISFDPDLLLAQKISLEGSRKKSSQDYLEFMKLIDFPTLRFRKVCCGYRALYILDTKNELWCVGACESGQLGISLGKKIDCYIF